MAKEKEKHNTIYPPVAGKGKKETKLIDAGDKKKGEK